MPRKRPVEERIQEAAAKLERLRDEKRINELKARMRSRTRGRKSRGRST